MCLSGTSRVALMVDCFLDCLIACCAGGRKGQCFLLWKEAQRKGGCALFGAISRNRGRMATSRFTRPQQRLDFTLARPPPAHVAGRTSWPAAMVGRGIARPEPKKMVAGRQGRRQRYIYIFCAPLCCQVGVALCLACGGWMALSVDWQAARRNSPRPAPPRPDPSLYRSKRLNNNLLQRARKCAAGRTGGCHLTRFWPPGRRRRERTRAALTAQNARAKCREGMRDGWAKSDLQTPSLHDTLR
jgi:hypothetical protein